MNKFVAKGISPITGKVKEYILYETSKDDKGHKSFMSPNNYNTIYKIDKCWSGLCLVTNKLHTASRTILLNVKLQKVM